jgi:hypothetical protein
MRVAILGMYVVMIPEYLTDYRPVSAAQEVLDILLDVLENPDKPRPEGETFFGRVVKEYVIQIPTLFVVHRF